MSSIPDLGYTLIYENMKIIVTHTSPDLDAITSCWLIKKFLPGWQDAIVKYVLAGNRIQESKNTNVNPIEVIGKDEVIHTDTGLGFFDHHQINDSNICASSLVWEYLKKQEVISGEGTEDKKEALDRLIKIVTEIDNFKEVFWPDPTADHYDFSLISIIDGLKMEKPGQDEYYLSFISDCLDAILHEFENRIWAEKEIKEKGYEFETRFGKALGIETINDTTIKLGQKMGYAMVIRKDPRKGYVRIKARPNKYQKTDEIDLTLAYEKLKKIDPEATWFLHISKKMLLNGTPKNPKMKPTKLSLNDIIETLRSI